MFDRLLKIDAKHVQGFYNRGLAKYFLNDTSGSCRDWHQAKKLGYRQAGEMIKKYCR
jgi:hypothetical protein